MSFVRTSAINKIAKMEKEIKVIQGGTSAGKTISILALLINKALLYNNLTIDIFSVTYSHLEVGAIKDFKKILVDTSRWIDKQWNATKHYYQFGNGSVIRFIALDKPDKARGPRRDILYVNEANLIPFETYYQLATRTNKEIFLDFNPVNTFWAHTEVLTKDNAEFIKLTYLDNEGLPIRIIEELESNRKKAEYSDYWKNWCKVYLDGEVGELEGTIFSFPEIIDNIPSEAALIGYGMDLGFTNDPTTLTALYKFNGKILIDEIIYQKGLISSDIVKIIKSNNINDIIYCESAEPRTITEMTNYGAKNIRAVKKGSIMSGINLMQEYQFIVTKRSSNIINEFKNYRWLESGKPIDAFNHCMDGIRYCMWMTMGYKESSGNGIYKFNF